MQQSHPDQNQDTQPSLLQVHREVHPVGPAIGMVRPSQPVGERWEKGPLQAGRRHTYSIFVRLGGQHGRVCLLDSQPLHGVGLVFRSGRAGIGYRRFAILTGQGADLRVPSFRARFSRNVDETSAAPCLIYPL